MTALAADFNLGYGVTLPGFNLRPSLKTLRPTSPWHPTKAGFELIWKELNKLERSLVDKYLRAGKYGDIAGMRDQTLILLMSGSDGNYLSKKFGDLIDGATAYTAPVTRYFGLWTSALDDTFTGATSGETNYTSYARLALTNNTTIFAAGSGTTTYSKSYPADAAKNFVTATGASTNPITFVGDLDGNAGSSADKGLKWCSCTSTPIASGDTPQFAQNAFTQTRD